MLKMIVQITGLGAGVGAVVGVVLALIGFIMSYAFDPAPLTLLQCGAIVLVTAIFGAAVTWFIAIMDATGNGY